jgi:GDP-L-fucose synthase
MEKNKILVTGGTGMVGKHLQDILPNADYLPSKICDLKDYNAVLKGIEYEGYNTVIHLAAKVGGIKDNLADPVGYFEDNLLMNTNILKASYKNGVKKFIGVLSTCAYPDIVDKYPMTEEDLHKGPPAESNFGYGYAKRCLAVQIEAYNKQYGTEYQYIIPSNLYSEYDNKLENKSHFLNALIHKIMKAEKEGKKEIELWGTGKPLRQFTYAGDLAKAIYYIINDDIKGSFNFSYPNNYTIEDLAIIALNALGHFDWEIKYIHPELDGQFRKDVSVRRFTDAFGEQFIYTSLEKGIKRVYDKISFRYNQ